MGRGLYARGFIVNRLMLQTRLGRGLQKMNELFGEYYVTIMINLLRNVAIVLNIFGCILLFLLICYVFVS